MARAGLLLSILLAAVPAAAPAPAAPPGYVSETLPNGLRVSILPDPTMPIVATQVWYHVGSANEEPASRGLAHLFEHLLFGGTPSHPERAVWDHHEAFGGDTNAFTSFDETVYVSAIPPSGFDDVLELEADRMVNLSLDEENLANEKRIVTEELRLSTENDPLSRLFTAVLEGILGEHPYALTPVGTKEDVAAATLDRAREFYRRHYGPRNAHLVVVGPVDATATLARVHAAFGPLAPGGETPADVPDVTTLELPELLVLEEDLPPVEIAVIGFPLPASSHPDGPAIEVLRQILAAGALDLFEDELVRRRHRALLAGTETQRARRGGVVAFYAANLPYRRRATAFRHLEEARAFLGRFEWLDGARLSAAKRALAARHAQRGYHAAAMADAIGRAAWWQGDEASAFDETARIEAVTLEDVQAAFRRYILDAKPVKVYVRPERVPLHVRLFGWLYPLLGGG
jgi:zinc protease